MKRRLGGGLCKLVVVVFGLVAGVSASEYPERECCDPYPLPPPPSSTTPYPSAATPTGHSGSKDNAAVAILKCLLARQLCVNDASCSAILEIIPRVCGPEQVACSTVTVTKCQAALRTLQAFPFFRPTCLCREPQLDPACNSFRDFLFDHPCIYVSKKEKDPYPVDALPTCNHALSVCQGEKKCIKLYEDFKTNCKVRDGSCRMENRDMCHEAWTKLRMSPMFGCICPNNHMKRKCDRIFSIVNHNPCVVQVISSENTSFDGIESQVENPLVDRGSNQKDLNVLRYEVPSVTDGVNASKIDEEGDMRGSRMTYSPAVNAQVPPSAEFNGDTRTFSYQSTCHIALHQCNNDYSCRHALQPVLQFCDSSSCNRESCMKALQNFYGTADVKWTMEVAFCLCKKTGNKHDECLEAQEKLHPKCAQRIQGMPLPTCHTLANTCRSDATCKSRLESYEQGCAVDSVTKKCAGLPSGCRDSMLNILGTELRSNCACKGTDVTQIYDCVGWQRLLWINPCVVEAQKLFHMERFKAITMSTSTTTRTMPAITERTTVTSSTTPTSTTSFSTEMSTSTTQSTTTTTTQPPRYCIKQMSQNNEQSIREGSGKRIYREDEAECSEVCLCFDGKELQCSAVCVDRTPCQTEFAFYNHAAPAIQAFRSQCICYSGSFICMRPEPDKYKLPQGVFLFVGYSEKDEAQLRPRTALTVYNDAVPYLQKLMTPVEGKPECTLYLYNVTKENLIIVAKLADENFTFSREALHKTSPDTLRKEKEVCSGPLEEISQKINNRHPEVHSHMLLSAFKVAEVEVKVPNVGSGSASSHFSMFCLLGAPLLLLISKPTS